MITRKEKLLIRPWEQKRYENHLRKVRLASPAIDVGPPAHHVHVVSKLKKQQKENERCDKIEKDNLKLLQRLRKIMSTSRVDNTWFNAQPNFLHRIELYNANMKEKQIGKDNFGILETEKKSRKERCYACTPQKLQDRMIPEERVPWPPPKPQMSRKRSQSLPAKPEDVKHESPYEKNSSTSSKNSSAKSTKKPILRSKTSHPNLQKMPVQSTPTIILSRNDLHLALNFPSDTMVKLKDGTTEKLIFRGNCQCKAMKGF